MKILWKQPQDFLSFVCSNWICCYMSTSSRQCWCRSTIVLQQTNQNYYWLQKNSTFIELQNWFKIDNLFHSLYKCYIKHSVFMKLSLWNCQEALEINCLYNNTLVYRIEADAQFLILRKKYTLHDLILVCTFIDFEKTFPPAHLLVSTFFSLL